MLVDVYGMGVLLLGESGIGKSECALDLVHRGHRLVADDAVEIRRYPSGALVGRAAEMIRYHMELRGIGIINIKHLFGVSAVRGLEVDRARHRAPALGPDQEVRPARASTARPTRSWTASCRCCGCPWPRAATSRS